RQGDVKRFSGVRHHEGTEAQSKRAAVVRHGEDTIARVEGGRAVVLADVVSVGGVGAGAAVAGGSSRSVEADHAEVAGDVGVDAGDDLILFAHGLGKELVQLAAGGIHGISALPAVQIRIDLVGVDGDQLVRAEGVQVGDGGGGALGDLPLDAGAELAHVGGVERGREPVSH